MTYDLSSWQMPEHTLVSVRLLWDVLAQDPDRWPPMYVLWKLHSEYVGWRGSIGGAVVSAPLSNLPFSPSL